ncbi:putative Rrf2 family DNA-binding protein [Gordonia hirsuta DSM 44140 = NBRC 16056]|uniref:Putative Rrf2 family DNA-binding protein n=1 Tax=Gordonia hirsuta DSM 44140 = NBRC 16056 TaxID=1121927 RepID=L7LE59_9ACTN|nr:Rrf2 family transcriptional regulator [Gordonia hirsuta]GAC58357.1 putative Rrf2 family DNA-binding protein [Gordonia hirsuta DSM 44140 = NBRC 16056]
MQLTRFTDIGLRVLMRLAADSGTTTRTARDLAAELSVPPTHTAKVVSRLSEIGVVHSRRGRSGGLSITSLGRTARVGWVVRQLEGDDPVVDCDAATPCPLLPSCRLRGALARAQNAFYDSLDALTVSDLALPASGDTEHAGTGAGRVLPLISRTAAVRDAGAGSGPSSTLSAENRNRS